MHQDDSKVVSLETPGIERLRELLGETSCPSGTELREVVSHLEDLSDALDDGSRVGTAGLCRVVAQLLDTFLEKPRLESEDVLCAVRGVVDHLFSSRTALQFQELQNGLSRVMASLAQSFPSAPMPATSPADNRTPTGHAGVDRTRLGEILVSLATIESEELELALRTQAMTDRRIGETLLEMGLINETQLSEALRIQAEHSQTEVIGGDHQAPD